MKKEFFIAGVQFRPKEEIAKAIKQMEEGIFLELRPDPTNKYDPNAVQIMYRIEDFSAFLGYVPAKFSAEVSASLEIGDVVCKVTQLNPTAKPWEKIRIVVTNEEEDNMDEDDFEDYLDDEDDEDE